MFKENDFKIAYKAAYDRVVPDQSCIRRLEAGQWKRPRRRTLVRVLRPAAAAIVVLCLAGVVSLPALAKADTRIYGIVARYAPALMDYVLPEQFVSTSSDLTMQVEAVKVEGREAELLISFRDAGDDTDWIKGEADLLEGAYQLQSYGSLFNIGGCRFLEYDEAEDKAYFKIQLTANEEFDGDYVTLQVYRILTDHREEQRFLDLTDVTENPPMQWVTISGRGGSLQDETFDPYFGKTDGDPRPTAYVMEIPGMEKDLSGDLTVTAIGYADGILRVQTCRGNLTNADRHARLFLADQAGEEQQVSDLGVMWHEEVDGVRLCFDEDWFVLEEDELENLRLGGDFYVTAGCVEGEWGVTLKIE